MYQAYQVQEGDNLFTIAEKFGMEPGQLGQINGLLLDTPLTVGSYIVVPTMDNQVFEIYTVQKGDNLYQIAERFNTTMEDLAAINGLDPDEYIYPNQQLLIPKEGVQVYVTKDGDTLNEVVNRLQAIPLELVLQNVRIYLLPNQLIIYKKENFQ